jgi:glycosyltransferase involved in cell wall biosynthesis
LRCLFLAPLKPPDDPEPSGDRLIGGLFQQMLGRLGFDARLASRLRTRCREPEALQGIEREAAEEFDRIIVEEQNRKDPAALVFTYHNNWRAPDILGPRLAQALGIPYVLAESSRAPKRALGPFSAGHALAEAASDAASLIIAPTAHDMEMLERLRPPAQTLALCPPFLDQAVWPAPPVKAVEAGPIRLATAAMMRSGRKADSFHALAEALARIEERSWTLAVAGDGPEAPAVRAAFARFGERVRFHGALQGPAAMQSFLAAADLFVWPAIEEPFGMVFLEAQSQGLPCIAYRYRGVPDVLADGVAGRLVPPGDTEALSLAIAELIDDGAERRRLGEAARRRFAERHTLAAALGTVGRAFAEAGIALP